MSSKKTAVVVEQEAVVETPVVETVAGTQTELDAQYPDYMSFAQCAKTLGVRFQQVYQRAVVRNKMQWMTVGKHKLVRKADVAAWAVVRNEYFQEK